MMTRLARYVTGRQAYLNPDIDWKEVAACVEYVVGIGERFPRRDREKRYILFDEESIRRDTGGHIIPIPLDLELATQTNQQLNYNTCKGEAYGFYDPVVMKEALIALLGIKNTGFQIKANIERS